MHNFGWKILLFAVIPLSLGFGSACSKSDGGSSIDLGPAFSPVMVTATVTRFNSSNQTTIQVWVFVNSVLETGVVTLTGPSGPLSIPSLILAGLHDLTTTAAAYVPGAVYTLTVVTSAGTVSGAIVAPGAVTIRTDGSQVSWTSEGNSDLISVAGPSGTVFQTALGGDVASPVNIPIATYALPGNYNIIAQIRTSLTSLTGGGIASSFSMTDDQQLIYVVP